ncbi:OmpA family protein [Spongiivirga citrea]|uniref:OmpA family protein n=2 Tax=Spongiivirga citrea TaxID=1481457 RepID=A0A6M0CHX6_9FLAO|nr:OmpA family protein [Spongiivirga citrea]
MKQRILNLIVLLSLGLGAQSKYKKADQLFEKMWYIEAAEHYESAVKGGDNSQELLQKVGDAYYFNTDMQNASRWYGILFSKYENRLSPTYAFRYIHSLQGIGDYDLAKGLMKIYGDKLDTSGFNVDQFQNNDTNIDRIVNAQPQFYIANVATNTKFSDFAPMFYEDKVVFAAVKNQSVFHKRNYKWNEQPYLNLFIADVDSTSVDLTNKTDFSEEVSTKYHEAAVAFTPDQKTIYFTRNNIANNKSKLQRDDQGVNHLKLYKAVLKDSIWTDVQELPFNSDYYSVGHPSLSKDGKKLYFVSDMPGTIGGTDIFVVDIQGDDVYGTPKNLGPTINTAGREMFPFITNNKLYFASDGHLGLGGLDVFESKIQNSFSEPENLGKPLNGKKDDFAYIVDEDTQRGYFSSNRDGGIGDDDIYSFQRIKVVCLQEVEGTVANAQNGIPESGIKVSLFDEKGNEVDSSTTNANGEYHFDFEANCETNYKVVATKDGFEKSSKSFVTKTRNGEVNRVPLGIKKLDDLIVKDDNQFKIDVGIIFFDFDKSNIRSDAASELNKVVYIMTKYPKMIIKIESHTDARGVDSYNLKLSDERAKSTRDYIISQGIEESRIESAIGYGETKLLNSCSNNVYCTDNQHDLNRRSEFIITRID